jgi:hypothetical protein
MQGVISEGYRRKVVIGVDEETFRLVLDWIYASVFPKPELTGTFLISRAIVEYSRAYHLSHCMCRDENVYQVVQRGR